jgi:asparagine synthase (glutamine-hydrolysing)
MIRWNNTSRIKNFFSKELKGRIGAYDGYAEVGGLLPPAYKDWDSVVKAQFLEMSIFLSNYLLSSQGDRVAMANSLEIRLPYLDPRLMEFVARVPTKWKIFGLDEKYILKRAFKNILPEGITSRPKHPYRAPISESLLNEASAPYAGEMLSDEALKRTGLFDAAKVGRLVKMLRARGGTSEVNNMALVGILSAQLIHLQYVDDFPHRPPHSKRPDIVVDHRSR